DNPRLPTRVLSILQTSTGGRNSMIRKTLPFALAMLIMSPCLLLLAQHAAVPDAAVDSPSTPVSRMDEPAWRGRFEGKQKIAQRTKQVDLLFLGDSITHNYERS